MAYGDDIRVLGSSLGGLVVTGDDPGASYTTASRLSRALAGEGCDSRMAGMIVEAMVAMLSGAEAARDRMRAQAEAHRAQEEERQRATAARRVEQEDAARLARQAARDEKECEARRLGRYHRERGLRDVALVVRKVTTDRPELAGFELYIRLGYEGADERAASNALSPHRT